MIKALGLSMLTVVLALSQGRVSAQPSDFPEITAGEISAIRRDVAIEPLPLSVLVQATSLEIPDCEKWCDPASPDYRCFQVGSLDQGRESQVRELITRLTMDQPLVLSHADLIHIFNVDGQGFDGMRSDTMVAGDVLTNSGSDSLISASTAAGQKISIVVPKKIQFSYLPYQNKEGFSLSRYSIDSSFFIQISDPVLHRQYGGSVQSISVKREVSIIRTDRGCISYDTRARLDNGRVVMRYLATLARRMAAERAVGAGEDRMSRVRDSYVRAALLSNGTCERKTCMSCDGENQISCHTSLGDTCIDATSCYKNGGSMCQSD